jgi:EAL domain-containing protein (putative c-di-GMP-specific phosphodiesterase class I)
VVEQTKGDEAIAAERAEKAGRIHRAIDNEEIVSVYQPIFDLNSGKPAGYEALSRFTGKPERGPLQWFAEADEVGLGFDLEIAAASFAMRVASAHLDEQLARGFLSVNASPATLLTEGFAETLGEGFPPDRVVVEVTEHARIEDYAEFKQAFSGLRSQGVRLAVDDVGAGYASLRHILSLEPDVIKLDLSLTRDIESDRRKRALAAALISFAAETESTVVAEGIETEPELDALVTLGAQLGQGYHLVRPGPLGNLGDNGSGRG